MVQPTGKQYDSFSKNLKKEFFFKKSKISLPGIYQEKTILRRDTCTPMFIAALFTIAKTWKQPMSIDR